jgi:hypothetical protein
LPTYYAKIAPKDFFKKKPEDKMMSHTNTRFLLSPSFDSFVFVLLKKTTNFLLGGGMHIIEKTFLLSSLSNVIVFIFVRD